jgi:hypothetical protein
LKEQQQRRKKKEMSKRKGNAQKNAALPPYDENVLTSALSEIETHFRERVTGTYPRFDKLFFSMQLYYQWGSSDVIPVLEPVLGPRQISKGGPYGPLWFGEHLSEWRLYYRSDLDKPALIPLINAAAALTGKGLEVKVSGILGAGNGLFTTHAFERNSLLTYYGGNQMSVDAMECLGLSDEYRNYVLVAPNKVGGKVYDAQIFFALANEMGRWPNSDRERVNARFQFVEGTDAPVIVASRDLQAGEEVLLDYGTQFQLQLQCQLCEQWSVLMCQRCETSICGKACQTRHWESGECSHL